MKTIVKFWLYAFAGLLVFACKPNEIKNTAPVTYYQPFFSVNQRSTSDSNSIRFVGVGDIMLGSNYPSASYLPPNDGKDLLDEVKPFLLDADVTFGNLEGTYLDAGGSVKKCSNPNICYAFRSPVRYLDYIKDAGFDLLSLANNHSGDFGSEGRNSTKKELAARGLAYAGLTDCPTAVIERNGRKIGFVAFAPNSGTIDIRDMSKAAALVADLDKIADIIVVSFHGGAEGAAYQHVPFGAETYLGENRGNLRLFTHALIDAGADVIFGHGPHVTRGIEMYKDRFIAYSLGNFATYGRFSLKGPNGLCPIVNVKTDTEGAFISGKISPVKQIGEGIPLIDAEKQVIKIMQNLSKTDFPDSPLVISEDGDVSKKD